MEYITYQEVQDFFHQEYVYHYKHLHLPFRATGLQKLQPVILNSVRSLPGEDTFKPPLKTNNLKNWMMGTCNLLHHNLTSWNNPPGFSQWALNPINKKGLKVVASTNIRDYICLRVFNTVHHFVFNHEFLSISTSGTFSPILWMNSWVGSPRRRTTHQSCATCVLPCQCCVHNQTRPVHTPGFPLSSHGMAGKLTQLAVWSIPNFGDMEVSKWTQVCEGDM